MFPQLLPLCLVRAPPATQIIRGRAGCDMVNYVFFRTDLELLNVSRFILSVLHAEQARGIISSVDCLLDASFETIAFA